MSLPEVLLWRSLRTRPMGLKFRKQHPIGNFVADFYCDAAKTIVEIDGIAHDAGNRPDRDLRRDAILKTEGYRIIRIPTADVLEAPELIADSIVTLCNVEGGPGAPRGAPPPPLRQPFGLPPPPAGEVLRSA
jgi:very-short-patch-repair endonuclease